MFDPNVVDKQLGCAGLLKAMMAIDPSIQFGPVGQPQRKTPDPPKDITDAATKNERTTRKGALAGTAAGGVNEVAKSTGNTEKPASVPLMPSYIAYNLVAVGIVVAIIATVLIRNKITRSRRSGNHGASPCGLPQFFWSISSF